MITMYVKYVEGDLPRNSEIGYAGFVHGIKFIDMLKVTR